jgi:enolase
MPIVEELRGREILDSRGTPTVEAMCKLRGGASARASVPSGASVGGAEATEVRDGDLSRYGGRGCRRAAANISTVIHNSVVGREFHDQSEFDHALLTADGTVNKSSLGGNAILAASVAFARASAHENNIPLWRKFAEIAGCEPSTFPRLTINLFSGGRHAGHQVPVQDVLIIPMKANSIDESLSIAWDIYQAGAKLVLKRYGMRLLRADEGGMAPPFASEEEMIETALLAIREAGYDPGSDVPLAIDVASSHFFRDRSYRLKNENLTSRGMVQRIRSWVNSWPIRSVEDGLAEEDWEHWPELCEEIGTQALVVGDDLLCTNAARIQRAIESRACNTLLLKPNQAGTLTEAAEALLLARNAGWSVTVSVRSGETEDSWAADLAFGWCADAFKNGSITQSERLAKYNRLLEIEGSIKAPLASWPTIRPQTECN